MRRSLSVRAGELCTPIPHSPKEWRITIRTPEELACGALPKASVSQPFEAAAREFETLLQRDWGVAGPLTWEEIRPDWWGVDVVPGALEATGEKPA
jgi:hypothetical protein